MYTILLKGAPESLSCTLLSLPACQKLHLKYGAYFVNEHPEPLNTLREVVTIRSELSKEIKREIFIISVQSKKRKTEEGTRRAPEVCGC